jgi:8-oxo-dGTP pyrophosphatase MutT (NUDIX family)
VGDLRRPVPAQGTSFYSPQPTIRNPHSADALSLFTLHRVILVSPSNCILLTHRVQTSSAFPSAHVFPGGNLSPADGILPASGVARHTDNLAYRTGAIRELFEESGILLARNSITNNITNSNNNNAHRSSGLLSVSARDRLRGRRAIHSENVRFSTWLRQQSPTAQLDTANLIPFTHWITPANWPERFSTQLYLYFVPVEEEGNESLHATSDESENTAADWKSASEWIALSRRGDIILFAPQFLLLYLVSLHLDRAGEAAETRQEIETRRAALRLFVEQDGNPPWRDKCISPLNPLGGGRTMRDGRTVLAIDQPGLELEGSGLRGDGERVIFVDGPRAVDVGWRREVEEDHMQTRQEEDGKKDGPDL